MSEKKSLIDLVEQRKENGELVPLTATFELTQACNLRCRHCYLENCQGNRDELTTDQWRYCIDQAVDLGVYFGSFTGGEILMRDDFMDIARYAYRKGVFFGLQTNGTRIDAPMADAVKDLNPTKVEISLYGAGAQSHDGITQVPGSFVKSITAVELLLKRDIQVTIKMTVMSANKDQVQPLRKIVSDLGAGFSADPIVIPGMSGSQETASLRMDDDEFHDYMISEGWGSNADKEVDDLVKDGDRSDRRVLCTSAKKRFCISARGDVFPCIIWRHNCGNLLQSDLESIWLGVEMTLLRQLKFVDLKQCTKCDTYGSCVRCAGLAEIDTGDYKGCPSECRRMSRILSEIKRNNRE